MKTISFTKSVRAAISGLGYVVTHERNFRIEIFALGLLIGILWVIDVELWRIVVCLTLAGLVMTMELMNTAIERTVDVFKPQKHPYARVIKDIAAAGVLMMSLTAASVGMIVLYEPVISFFSKYFV